MIRSPGANPGTHALLLRAEHPSSVQSGRLGPLRVRRGWYLHVGSALGPGGLAGRLGHHGRRVRRPRWHVDYLRSGAVLREAWCATGSERQEHRWARALAGMPGAELPLRGFGSSDCRCAAHLHRFARRPSWSDFRRRLSQESGTTIALHRCRPSEDRA